MTDAHPFVPDVTPTEDSSVTSVTDVTDVTENEDEETTTLDPNENEIEDSDSMSQQKTAQIDSVPIILGTCAALFCLITLSVYIVVRRKKFSKFGINKELEENMTQSMKNLEAQNFIETSESDDNPDDDEDNTGVSMKYKKSYSYDPTIHNPQ